MLWKISIFSFSFLSESRVVGSCACYNLTSALLRFQFTNEVCARSLYGIVAGSVRRSFQSCVFRSLRSLRVYNVFSRRTKSFMCLYIFKSTCCCLCFSLFRSFSIFLRCASHCVVRRMASNWNRCWIYILSFISFNFIHVFVTISESEKYFPRLFSSISSKYSYLLRGWILCLFRRISWNIYAWKIMLFFFLYRFTNSNKIYYVLWETFLVCGVVHSVISSRRLNVYLSCNGLLYG